MRSTTKRSATARTTRGTQNSKPAPAIIRNELHCHECDKYVQFQIDSGLNGNHVIKCPVCGHEHCRVVKDGVITGDRWDQRNGATVYVSSVTYTTFSIDSTSTASTGSSIYLSDLWFQTTSTG